MLNPCINVTLSSSTNIDFVVEKTGCCPGTCCEGPAGTGKSDTATVVNALFKCSKGYSALIINDISSSALSSHHQMLPGVPIMYVTYSKINLKC